MLAGDPGLSCNVEGVGTLNGPRAVGELLPTALLTQHEDHDSARNQGCFELLGAKRGCDFPRCVPRMQNIAEGRLAASLQWNHNETSGGRDQL